MRLFPLKLLKNPQVPIEEGVVSNVETREAITRFTQVMAIHVTRGNKVKINPNDNTTISRIRDFTSINPHTFFGS